MSTSGSKSNEHVAHFLVDIHTYFVEQKKRKVLEIAMFLAF